MNTYKPLPVSIIENILFNVKWILPLFYLGLIIVMGLYGWSYTTNLYELIIHGHYTVDEMKIITLDMVDVVMVANLVKMIITGSYHSFVSKLHGKEAGNTSSGLLKIKIASSIVVVCMINLLRTFVALPEHPLPWDEIYKGVLIFGSFLIGTGVLAGIEYLHVKCEVLESSHHNTTPTKQESDHHA